MLIPLTVPEARRLLRMAADTPEQQRHGLRWSRWRRDTKTWTDRGCDDNGGTRYTDAD